VILDDEKLSVHHRYRWLRCSQCKEEKLQRRAGRIMKVLQVNEQRISQREDLDWDGPNQKNNPLRVALCFFTASSNQGS
jgi:hypothetical protein